MPRVGVLVSTTTSTWNDSPGWTLRVAGSIVTLVPPAAAAGSAPAIMAPSTSSAKPSMLSPANRPISGFRRMFLHLSKGASRDGWLFEIGRRRQLERAQRRGIVHVVRREQFVCARLVHRRGAPRQADEDETSDSEAYLQREKAKDERPVHAWCGSSQHTKAGEVAGGGRYCPGGWLGGSGQRDPLPARSVEVGQIQ